MHIMNVTDNLQLVFGPFLFTQYDIHAMYTYEDFICKNQLPPSDKLNFRHLITRPHFRSFLFFIQAFYKNWQMRSEQGKMLTPWELKQLDLSVFAIKPNIITMQTMPLCKTICLCALQPMSDLDLARVLPSEHTQDQSNYCPCGVITVILLILS